MPPEDSMSMVELGRSMGRLEATMNGVSAKIDTFAVNQAVQDIRVKNLEDDMSEMKERERFRARLVASAFLTALIGPLLFYLQVKQ